MANPTQYNILNSLTLAAMRTSVEHVYINNRPKTSDAKIKSFVVISLPARIDRKVKGNDDFIVATTGVFFIGMRAKQDNTPNVKAQTQLVQQFMDLFPISDDYISATKPTILDRGDDETGFQITSVMFDVRTKINSYLK